MLGTDFPYRPFFPDDAKVIQVDVRGENIGRRVDVDVALVGTVKDTIPALQSRLRSGHDGDHLQRMTAHYRRTRKKLDELAYASGDDGPIHPQVLTRVVDELAADDAVFTADVGTPTLWAARYLTMNGRRRLLGSFNHGTMANALPQAIGVQAAQPGRQVISLSGDGGLAMLMGELLTLRQLALPVKIVVYNNGALAFVELEMKADGIVNFGTNLDNPSFAAIAAAVGLHGVRIERPSELEAGVRSALAHPGPALIEVMTTRHELSIPPRVTADQVKGFTLWATRSILSGRGDEVLEVTKSNLRELPLV
jgi:pyruvate dehydrogenase (quinone)